ncbi:hypothetical protein HHI36_021032 [Cryptolaemus montrouzieri]|uniref:ABC-2 type transporter transmembrane domain-containing protein n=1 Tax=Cryptolaemus montrouzieri TaxID=559131 RepID=A0ABD2MWI6_9CUCU
MYRTDVYFLSKIITDIPIYSLLNAMNVTICYYFTGLNPQWSRWLECVFIMVLVTNAVMGAGYLISTISTSLQMAQTLVTAIVTPFLIFGGMFLNMKSVPSYLQWVADISWFKYGNQALLINQWLNVHDIICGSVPFCERDGYEVLESNGVEPYYLVSSIVTLAILAVVFRILSFLALLHKAYYYE